MRRDGVAEVLKVICLPVAGTTEEELAIQQQEIGRARREVALLRECRSPFVVKLGSVAPEIRELEGEACVIYTEELLPGRELKAAIGPSNLPQAGEIRRLLRCLVKAIQALWTEQRTVHRDIKPGNIFATGLADRPYVLLDLGIAYRVTEPGLTAQTGYIPATPRYSARRCSTRTSAESLSFRADLYTAGVTAFEFQLAARIPWRGRRTTWFRRSPGFFTRSRGGWATSGRTCLPNWRAW